MAFQDWLTKFSKLNSAKCYQNLMHMGKRFICAQPCKCIVKQNAHILWLNSAIYVCS